MNTLRSLAPFVFALALSGGALVWFYMVSRHDLPPPGVLEVVPHEATSLWYAHRASLLSQPESAILLTSFDGCTELIQQVFHTEVPAEIGDVAAYSWGEPLNCGVVFGLPAGWSTRQQEQWCIRELGAQPMRSGLLQLTLGSEMYYVRVLGNRCYITTTEAPPPMNESEEWTALARLSRMGSKKAWVQVTRKDDGASMVPFYPSTAPAYVVRDVYPYADRFVGEAIEMGERAFEGMTAVHSSWLSYIPDEVSAFEAVGLASGYALIETAKHDLASRGELASWNARLAELETHYGVSAESAFGSWWSKGLAVFKAYGHTYVMLGSIDQPAALRGLQAVGGELQSKVGEGTLIAWENPDFAHHLFSFSWNSHLKSAWVGQRTVVFSDAPENLVRLIVRLAAGRGLNENHLIAQAVKRGEHFVRYATGAESKSLVSAIELEPNATEWSAVHGILSGVVASKGRQVVRFEISPIATNEADQIALNWEFPVSQIRPSTLSAVKDHSTGGHFILIQDSAYTLHAINSAGQPMWRYRADGAIIGKVASVDLYRNGKFQAVFTTAGAIHCVDRLGRSVEEFPIRPKGVSQYPIVTPLLVADYDNNRNYRFIVGTSDGAIYNYASDAKPTKGWKYRSMGPNALHIEHLRAGTTDVLFVAYANGEVGLLKRNGERRFTTALQLPAFNQPLLFRLGSELESSTVILCDTIATGYEGRLLSTVNTLKPVRDAEAMAIIDFQGDRLFDLVSILGPTLRSFNADGHVRFERVFNAPLAAEITPLTVNGRTCAGVWVPEERFFYAIDADGGVLNGFPIFTGSANVVMQHFSGDAKRLLIASDGAGAVMAYSMP